MEYQRNIILSTLPDTGLLFTLYNHTVYLEAYEGNTTVKIKTDDDLFKTFVKGLKDHINREYVLKCSEDEIIGAAIVQYPRIWWVNKAFRISVKHQFTKEEWSDFLSNLIVLEKYVNGSDSYWS